MSLIAIVRTYIRHKRPKAQVELDWFRQQSSLKLAIENASLAINSEGKRYRHQCRFKRVTLKKAKKILLIKSRVIAKSKSFDELFDIVQTSVYSISGIGELYVYDTSLRIGAALNLLPSKVYLHAGTRIGAKALGFDSRLKALEVAALPSEFQQLKPHEIEDVLCIFKDNLKAIGARKSDKKIMLGSWCD